jgi:hypothetical protein
MITPRLPLRAKVDWIESTATVVPEDRDEIRLAHNFTGKEVMYLEAREGMSLEHVVHLEIAMNHREYQSHSNQRYRILPPGLSRIETATGKSYPDKVLLRCKYCGQYGAIYCACPSCGAPIGVPILD